MATLEDPKAMVERGCKANDTTIVARGMEAARAANIGQKISDFGLRTAMNSGNIAVVRYLLEEEKASAKGLNPLTVARNASIELLQLLVDHGFDLNEPASYVPTPGVGGYLLQRVCGDDELVRWCVEHGAKVNGMEVDPYKSPPLLQSVAAGGTVESFIYLLEKGAEFEGRILHVAAGWVGAEKVVWKDADLDDKNDKEKKKEERRKKDEEIKIYFQKRMRMVEYLVDVLKLDVNEMDIHALGSEESMPNFWGTPICYAARNPTDGDEVVKFLLERGADPYIKEAMDDYNDAFGYAKQEGNIKVAKVLEDWKSKQGNREV